MYLTQPSCAPRSATSRCGERLAWRSAPTAELAIEWLKALHSGQALAQEDAQRARALLVRYPTRIWEECTHWLNLAGEWTPVDGLSYALTMQSLIPWGHLHEWVKQKTADLQRLPAEVTGNPPFSHLPALAQHVDERFHQDPLFSGQPEKKEWLTALGAELRRVELDRGERHQTCSRPRRNTGQNRLASNTGAGDRPLHR